MESEILEELRSSQKFLQWRGSVKRSAKHPAAAPGRGKDFSYTGRRFSYTGRRYTNLVTTERYFSPSELAEIWGVSVQTIRDLFREEEGVLKFGSSGTRTKRARKTLRIPESVADRVHARLSA